MNLKQAQAFYANAVSYFNKAYSEVESKEEIKVFDYNLELKNLLAAEEQLLESFSEVLKRECKPKEWKKIEPLFLAAKSSNVNQERMKLLEKAEIHK
jgi:hypothetical protein